MGHTEEVTCAAAAAIGRNNRAADMEREEEDHGVASPAENRVLTAGAPPPADTRVLTAGAPPPESPQLGSTRGVSSCAGDRPLPAPFTTPTVSEPQAAPARSTEPSSDFRFETEETVLIFDWDDTVLPSAWVQAQGLSLDAGSMLSDWQRGQLSDVATAAAETFRLAKQLGTVVLVTNAERGWVELSCQKFLPSLYPSLESVNVLSARTTYGNAGLSSPSEWKLQAFEKEIQRIYGPVVPSHLESRKNVLSFGDSMHEREALFRATADLPNCRCKSLKFVEQPEIGQLCMQHSLVSHNFDHVVHHDGNLDLCLRPP